MGACIWDLDGTLIDSYGVMIESLQETFQIKAKLHLNKKETEKSILNDSIHGFLIRKCSEYGCSLEDVQKTFSALNRAKSLRIPEVRNAKAILAYLHATGCEHYVYTHNSRQAYEILKNLGMLAFFREVVTSENGFPRKPSPEGIQYLLEKYRLNRRSTFYVGDRNIDMECAQNANIQGILYLPRDSVVERTGREAYIVDDLIKIKEIVRG